VLPGSRNAGSDAAFIAAMQAVETEAQLARWKSWNDLSSWSQFEQQAVLADLSVLEDAFSPSSHAKRS
jgi:hypothetical protein